MNTRPISWLPWATSHETQPALMASIDTLLAQAQRQLHGRENARLDAEVLLAWLLKVERSYLYAHPEQTVMAEQQARFLHHISERNHGRPVAQLIGQREFWSLDLQVDEHTLIPRPETEHLVECVLDLMPRDIGYNLTDLGTGSGAIALAVASEHPRARIMATDISARALSVARRNATRLGLDSIYFHQGNWYQALGDALFEIIVSNPPYIAEDDPCLSEDGLCYEPREALAAGADGLDAIRVIIAGAPRHLRNNGWLVLEHGWDQGARVRQLLQQAGFSVISSRLDYAGHERVTLGCHGRDGP